MDEEIKAQLADLKKSVEAFSARIEKLEKAPATPAAPSTELQAKLDEAVALAADKAAEAALKKFAAQFGAPPAPPSSPATPPAPPAAPKKFEELVREHSKYGENKALAIREARAANPSAVAEYEQRLKNGEIILF